MCGKVPKYASVPYSAEMGQMCWWDNVLKITCVLKRSKWSKMCRDMLKLAKCANSCTNVLKSAQCAKIVQMH